LNLLCTQYGISVVRWQSLELSLARILHFTSDGGIGSEVLLDNCCCRQEFTGGQIACQWLENGGCMIKSLKNKRFAVAMMFLSTIALSSVAAHAQDYTLAVKAKIPFAFTAGKTQFSPGTYVFVPTEGVSPTLDVQNPKEKTHEMVLAEATKENMGKPMKPKLVFDRIGDKDFLRQVWIEQKDYSIEQSSNETSMEKRGLKPESYNIICRYIQERTEKAAEIAAHIR
jgi:hypothetical protein